MLFTVILDVEATSHGWLRSLVERVVREHEHMESTRAFSKVSYPLICIPRKSDKETFVWGRKHL